MELELVPVPVPSAEPEPLLDYRIGRKLLNQNFNHIIKIDLGTRLRPLILIVTILLGKFDYEK